MERLTDMICSCIEDLTDNDIRDIVTERNNCDVVEFFLEEIGIRIIVPKQSSLCGYVICAVPKIKIPKEQIFKAILVLNDFNDWAIGVNGAIKENDGSIWYKCVRCSHAEISEKEFESDFRRVLNSCLDNTPSIMEEIQSVERIIDFS